MTGAIEWSEPLPVNRDGDRAGNARPLRQGRTAVFASALEQRPGEWAEYRATTDDGYHATNTLQHLTRLGLEATSRSVPDTHPKRWRIWARWPEVLS